MRFGVTKLEHGRHCSMVGCRNIAIASIGDKRYSYNLKNLFLCEEHLKELYNALKEELGESISEEGIKHQELIKDYLKSLYESNGVISKAKVAELCVKHGIEIPEDSNMKKYMEAMFPEILEE